MKCNLCMLSNLSGFSLRWRRSRYVSISSSGRVPQFDEIHVTSYSVYSMLNSGMKTLSVSGKFSRRSEGGISSRFTPPYIAVGAIDVVTNRLELAALMRLGDRTNKFIGLLSERYTGFTPSLWSLRDRERGRMEALETELEKS